LGNAMQMKKCKKVLTSILVFGLIFAALCTMTACNPTQPEENTEPPATVPSTKPTLIVEGTKAKAGDENIEVIISIANNPGILGIDYDLFYEDSVMTLVNAESALELPGCVYTPPSYFRNPTTFLWDFQDANWVEDGVVLKLYFDISDTAPAGVHEIKIMYSYGNIFDADLKPIDVAVKNGYISID